MTGKLQQASAPSSSLYFHVRLSSLIPHLSSSFASLLALYSSSNQTRTVLPLSASSSRPAPHTHGLNRLSSINHSTIITNQSINHPLSSYCTASVLQNQFLPLAASHRAIPAYTVFSMPLTALDDLPKPSIESTQQVKSVSQPALRLADGLVAT